MRIYFDVEHSGELDAGIRPYTDRIVIDVESGDPGEHDPGEFAEHMREALQEWFVGAGVDIST